MSDTTRTLRDYYRQVIDTEPGTRRVWVDGVTDDYGPSPHKTLCEMLVAAGLAMTAEARARWLARVTRR